jgi:hypothetical protein
MRHYYTVTKGTKVQKTTSLAMARDIAGNDGEIKYKGRWLVK